MKAVLETTRVRFKNVLVATDFTPASRNAIRAAAGIAGQAEANVYLFHVVRPVVYPAEAAMVVPPNNEPAVELARAELTRLARTPRLAGIHHEEIVRCGAIWEELERVIREKHIDLIVVGTHEQTRVEKFVIGSVAEEIFRQAYCPVMTVGPSVTAREAGEAEFREILYATDFSVQSLRGAQYATALAQEHNADLTLMNVSEPPKERAVNAEMRAKAAIVARMRELVPEDANLWCEPHFRVEFGDPASRILGVADELNADLIIMGVHRGGVGASHAPWATASKVVQHALCPVLTIREHH